MAGGRAVNCYAVLHKGRAVAFLSPWCSFEGEIRVVQSCTIKSYCGMVNSYVVSVLFDLAIFLSRIIIIISAQAASRVGYLSLWCSDLAVNWLACRINNSSCFWTFRSGVVSVRRGVAGGRAANRCALSPKGPAVAFLSPWCFFEGEIRVVQSCTIKS